MQGMDEIVLATLGQDTCSTLGLVGMAPWDSESGATCHHRCRRDVTMQMGGAGRNGEAVLGLVFECVCPRRRRKYSITDQKVLGWE